MSSSPQDSGQLAPEAALLEKFLQLVQQRLSVYEPFPKQAEFHAAGKDHRQRCMLAGNQLGKTLSAGMEVAIHLTGDYPDWWEGRRFYGPTRWWASNTNNETTRDNPQRILLGKDCEWGTGTIPADRIDKRPTMSRGFPDLVDTVGIRHKNGGLSHLSFKCYEQGRKKWQGETLDGIWFDEEPDSEVYSEGVTRTNVPQGITMITATPLLGMTEVVGHFYPEPDLKLRHLTQMEIWDVPDWLYSPEAKQEVVDSYPKHERESRARGIPMRGSGLVFPVPESVFVVPAFKIPAHWARLGGMDFGWDHPFGAVSTAWDRDSDVLYVTDCYKSHETTPPIHAAALKPWGDWIMYAWPHDGGQHDKGSGKALSDQYRQQGVKMCREHSTFRDGGFSPEAAALEVLTRMKTGRFKVFEHLEEWLAECRQYHRKDGKIVAKFDDLISATMKAVMMKDRYARTNDAPVMPAMAEDWGPFTQATA